VSYSQLLAGRGRIYCAFVVASHSHPVKGSALSSAVVTLSFASHPLSHPAFFRFHPLTYSSCASQMRIIKE
jgi:hypothetical protein